MAIKVGSPFQPASALSGGTQQKVVIGKYMEANPEVVLFVDATRGIDVQTKFEFYEMLRRLADGGAACVLYSSDTEELVGLCDRVAVFHDGVPALMLEGDEISQDSVVAASFAVVREGDVRRHPRPAAPFIPAVLVVVLFLVYLVQNNGSFGAIEALGITNAALPLALVAAGETFVILTNGIDLSIGVDRHAVERHVRGRRRQGPRGPRRRPRPRAWGSAPGCSTASIVSFSGIAPLIATLATSSIYAGLALIVLPTPGGSVPAWLSNVTAGSVHGIPVAVFWLALGIATGWAILHRLPFGIYLRALGGSESASWSAGINVVGIRILAYVASGFYCRPRRHHARRPDAERRPDDRRRLSC